LLDLTTSGAVFLDVRGGSSLPLAHVGKTIARQRIMKQNAPHSVNDAPRFVFHSLRCIALQLFLA
jgi:hypothetical protein